MNTKIKFTTFVHVIIKEIFEKLNIFIKEPLDSGNLATSALKGGPSCIVRLAIYNNSSKSGQWPNDSLIMHQNQEFRTRISDSSADGHLLHLHPVVVRIPFPHNKKEEEKSNKRSMAGIIQWGDKKGSPKKGQKMHNLQSPKRGRELVSLVVRNYLTHGHSNVTCMQIMRSNSSESSRTSITCQCDHPFYSKS
jgi:hypothetical protein